MNCPCGSEHSYENCCEVFHNGKELPKTALELMKSRYSAFAKSKIDYLVNTTAEPLKSDLDEDGLKQWSEESDWQRLDVVQTEEGEAGDIKGKVEFKAVYYVGDQLVVHHELSEFVNTDGEWKYKEGVMMTNEPIRNEIKIGRNDPCHCGSGKKYKKCCL